MRSVGTLCRAQWRSQSGVGMLRRHAPSACSIVRRHKAIDEVVQRHQTLPPLLVHVVPAHRTLVQGMLVEAFRKTGKV
jgi:hypothetical protein